MEETKGVEWRVFGWACYEDTFGFSEDNEHSFASSATGVARPGISNTVPNTNTAFIIIMSLSTLCGLWYQTHNHR